jgi:hypothetical protein
MGNTSNHPPRRGLAFWAGVVVTLIIVGVSYLYVSIVNDLSRWGAPVAISDSEVRAKLEERGLQLPNNAHHLYHSITGFTDHTSFMGYSANPEDVMNSAMAFAKRFGFQATFTTGTKSAYSFINDGPAKWGPTWETELWDITAVESGQFFEAKGLFILVDTKKSRVYICRWND